jgi:hypothetical protein
MNRNIMAIALLLVFAIACTITVFASTIPASVPEQEATVATFSEDYIPSETTFPVDTEPTETTEPEEVVIVLDTVVFKRVEPTTYDEACSLLEEAIARQELVETIYQGLLTLGYADDHPAVVMAQTDIENAELEVTYYQEQYLVWEEIHKWELRAAEYPVATQVWLYMKNELGFNDIVCAGIMGNMMAECGGCWTSDLDWDVSSSSGFGMIQWLGGRKQELFSIYGNTPSIENQLDFMKDELYGTNGVTKQVSDWQLDKIMNAETPEECAYAFACYFERCGEGHRAPRRGYARRAYEYFVG